MSVLIKGMRMPKNCEGCELADWYNGTICCFALNYTVDVSEMEQLCAMCPLVEVPTPHGRLIDADELEVDTEWSDYYDGYQSYSAMQIKYAPAVLESED